MNRPGVLIILPYGLAVGGVTSWAIRLANGLCANRPVGLVLHRPASDAASLTAEIDTRVRLFELSESVRVESANGDIRELARAYRGIVLELGGRAVLMPTLLGDCYGACADLTRDQTVDVRLIGWAHSENGYDVRVLDHYAPAMSHAGAVSHRLASEVRRCWAGREADVHWIPSGVESGGARVPRGPVRSIIYTGRMDEGVKRVSALLFMSDELIEQRVDHELRMVGDGPAGAEIDRLIKARNGSAIRKMERIAHANPGEIRRLLRASEFFVLPSRFEGLSVSMLEAMSEACCCVVTAENSGACEAIANRESGILLSTAAGASPQQAGHDLAEAILATTQAQASKIGKRAQEVAGSRFSLAAQVRATSDLIDRALKSPARRWPVDREAAFTARPGAIGSGTVPRDADVRMRLVMEGLRGRSVAVHGTGRHSVELAHVLGDYVAEIRAFVDDDPARQGSDFLGKPVVAPGVLARIGATDVVISSHLHQEAIWARRDEYERAGVRVHRLYA